MNAHAGHRADDRHHRRWLGLGLVLASALSAGAPSLTWSLAHAALVTTTIDWTGPLNSCPCVFGDVTVDASDGGVEAAAIAGGGFAPGTVAIYEPWLSDRMYVSFATPAAAVSFQAQALYFNQPEGFPGPNTVYVQENGSAGPIFSALSTGASDAPVFNLTGTISTLIFWADSGLPVSPPGDGDVAIGPLAYTIDPSDAVPEPASWGVLALGLLGLGMVRRRQSVKASWGRIY